MDQNEAYNLGVAFGKEVGGTITIIPGDTVEKFVLAGRTLCGTKVFSSKHPLAHVEHTDEIKAAFCGGEREGLRQSFVARTRI